MLQTSVGKPPPGLFKNTREDSLSHSVRRGIMRKGKSTAAGLDYWGKD